MRTPFALLITDTHSDKDNWSDAEDLYQQAFEVCKKRGINKIFLLGDVFTNRTGQALRVLNSFRKIVKEALALGIEFHAIAGNHDKTDQESEESYLDVCEDYPNFHLYKRETSLRIDGVNCFFLPYFPEHGSYFSRLQKLVKAARKTTNNNILFTHIAVDGVRNNDGSEVNNKLKTVFFKQFYKVFVGHYHDKSKVGDNIYYMGAASQRNFGEDDDKGFVLLYKDGSHEYVQADFSRYVKEVVKLANLDVDDVYALADDLSEHKKETGDRVRMVLVGTDEELATIDIARLKKKGIDVKQENLRILRSMEAAKTTPNLKVTKNNLFKQYIRYCAANKISPTLRRVGMNYVKAL